MPAAAKPPSSTAPSDIQFARAAEAAPAASPVSARVMIGLVLGDGPAARQPGGAQALRAAQARREPRQDAPDLGVAAPVDEDLVEAVVGAVGREAVALAQRDDEGLVLPAQLADVERAQARHRELGRQPVHDGEQGHDLVHVADVRVATRVNRCGAISTSPSSRRRLSASRTGVRLRPSQPHSSSSCSGSPGASVPSTIASQTFS